MKLLIIFLVLVAIASVLLAQTPEPIEPTHYPQTNVFSGATVTPSNLPPTSMPLPTATPLPQSTPPLVGTVVTLAPMPTATFFLPIGATSSLNRPLCYGKSAKLCR